MDATVTPLIFEPIYRPKVWGGRNLARLFGKQLPDAAAIGECWECADLDVGQSIVAAGPNKGRSLGDLVKQLGRDLLGRASLVGGRFPLMIKFLDCREPLSVQVHPDGAAAARFGGDVRPKDEAWYVIDASLDACIYLGLRAGIDREALSAAITSGEIDSALARVPVRAGQAFCVPAGTVHTLGGGLVVAEIETPSDTTFRLYDWGRSRPPGDAGMDIDRGLASIRFAPVAPARPARSHVGGLFTTVTRLVECDSFVVEKVRFVEGMDLEIPYAELVVWIVIEGCGELHYEPRNMQPFKAGDVIVLPAALRGGRVRTQSDCVWLEVTLPTPSDLAGLPRPSPAVLRAPHGSPADPMPLNVRIRKQKDGSE